jgi:transposase
VVPSCAIMTTTEHGVLIPQNRGDPTKQGPRAVRWVLVEAAHTAKRRPPYARDFAAIARRRGKPIATVAIARKLLARCYWVLKEAS